MPQPRSQPAPAHRDPALDGFRAIAVLMVYLFHYGGGLGSPNPLARALGYLTQTGWIGVIFFFALSGFLITGILWDSIGQRHWLRNFFTRRALRIFPLYYFALALTAAAILLTGQGSHKLPVLGYYAVFLQNFRRVVFHNFIIPTALPLYHFWSLAVEEQFYLVWPFLLLLCRRKPEAGNRKPETGSSKLIAATTPNQARSALYLCLGTFALSLAFRVAIFYSPHIANPQSFGELLPTQLGPLALGAALAIAIRCGSRARDLVQRAAVPAFLLGLALYLFSSYCSHSFLLTASLQYTLGLAAVSLLTTAAIPLLLREGPARRLCSLAPLAWLGRISYGFYIFHILLQPLFDLIGQHVTHTTSGSFYQLVRFVVGLPITIAVAWLSFHLFELPFLRLKRRFPTQQPLAEPAT
jgi:peptidoglycan/LPS O-acetylase OafA/YrhL